MIGWLQGQVLDPWQQSNRCGVVLVAGGVGYEVQLTRRQFAALPPPGASLVLHIHHAIREDGWQLFGFGERCERDLFRELVAVSGVGPQVALALLGELEPQPLVAAIIHADLRLLARAPGVGKRTAERLSVELRSRLQQRFSDLLSSADPALRDLDDPALAPDPALAGAGREEVQLTLTALGYEPLEIQRALRAVAAAAGQPGAEDPGSDPDAWIRGCLRWLSREAA
ncbi:MAG: Holliday junction branch migration protein RuvA [Cyanobacteriota bacterium]|nr:Holliday junction branch migration protein RuvA [Cyanobacteriota bacterium]